jgi:hypothetical protein
MNTSDIIVCTLEIICSVTYEVEWVTSHSCHSGQWWLTRGAVWTHFHSSELKIANAHGAPGLPIGSSHAGRCVPALHSKEYFFDSLLSPLTTLSSHYCAVSASFGMTYSLQHLPQDFTHQTGQVHQKTKSMDCSGVLCLLILCKFSEQVPETIQSIGITIPMNCEK